MGKKMAEEKPAEKRLSIGKIYLKDFSFESPQAPDVFRQSDWKPQTDLNLRSSHTKIDDDQHEIVLTITVEAKESDKTFFLVELQQAGLFEISGYEGDELGAIIGSFCPNILFPYARETIASLIQKGGFPEFVLQPINFDALYFQTKQKQAAAQAEEAEKH
ncbi:MAG: protein-export chaperone SecB [Gammaproteobacteria bacterium]|nr:protein-export chaperone SecB [Gammaproteobacteria bacterium]